VLILRDHVPRAREFASILMHRVTLPFGLTLREFDVLTLLAGGLSKEDISARLAISALTVAKHVENIFQKTALWSRSALAGYAVDQGLLRLPTPGDAEVTLLPSPGSKKSQTCSIIAARCSLKPDSRAFLRCAR
jgi:DNA-binding CsgD family transcriptional regulator